MYLFSCCSRLRSAHNVAFNLMKWSIKHMSPFWILSLQQVSHRLRKLANHVADQNLCAPNNDLHLNVCTNQQNRPTFNRSGPITVIEKHVWLSVDRRGRARADRLFLKITLFSCTDKNVLSTKCKSGSSGVHVHKHKCKLQACRPSHWMQTFHFPTYSAALNDKLQLHWQKQDPDWLSSTFTELLAHPETLYLGLNPGSLRHLSQVSFNLCNANSQQKKLSHSPIWSQSRPYSVIYLFTENQRFPHELALGDSGERKKSGYTEQCSDI